ncbi:hypothetical protein ACIA8O_20930 [Kitasatospora sp. NPDC051853]|uniref:hypothetical protein n=1 Tax=Kitasatospora sp. NPDC051853 TaxID=3364058 RepID=UPI0037991164
MIKKFRRTWSVATRRRRAAYCSLLALLLGAVLTLLPLATAAAALRLAYSGEPSPQAVTRGRDAVWLGHAWVDGRKGEADVAELTRLLAGTGVRDLYVHTGPLEHDGSLQAGRYPRARQFVEEVHRLLPRLRVQSWLGDVVRPEKEGLDLTDPAVRGRIAGAAGQVLDLGFDGVHYDLEPVRSGSAGFLDVLDRTRALTSARGVPLSVASPQIDPLPGLHRVTTAAFDHGKWWSQAYFADVARRVDQIAVMSYDTAMPVESLYGGYVAQQTELALEVTPPQVDLLMGLPAYWDDTFGHRGSAETVAAAVRGARLALGREAPGRQSFGLALYVDFTATPEHWAAYRSGWC